MGAGKPAHVNLVWGLGRRWRHRQHLCHIMVDTLHTTIAARVVGASVEFTNTKKLVDGVRNLRAELATVVARV